MGYYEKTIFDEVIDAVDKARAGVKEIQPDEEYAMHLEDELIAKLEKRGLDPYPYMCRVYEMMLKGLERTKKRDCDFGYMVASRELLDLLYCYERGEER